MPQEPVVTVDEQKLNDVWNEHLRAVEGDRPGDQDSLSVRVLLDHPGARFEGLSSREQG